MKDKLKAFGRYALALTMFLILGYVIGLIFVMIGAAIALTLTSFSWWQILVVLIGGCVMLFLYILEDMGKK